MELEPVEEVVGGQVGEALGHLGSIVTKEIDDDAAVAGVQNQLTRRATHHQRGLGPVAIDGADVEADVLG